MSALTLKNAMSMRDFFHYYYKYKPLMDYMDQLHNDGVQLEDLADMIDDASQETDALVQEMLRVRETLKLLKSGGESYQCLTFCLKERVAAFKKKLAVTQKLEETLEMCMV